MGVGPFSTRPSPLRRSRRLVARDELMRVLLGLCALIVLLYAGGVALLYGLQRMMVFPGALARASVDDAPQAGAHVVTLTTEDGERLAAWWTPPEPGRAVVLYFHGNGGSLANRRERFRALSAGGLGVLLVSYRGYLGSTGSPSEGGLRLDSRAAYGFLSAYGPGRIVLYGESLGTGVAVELASEREVGGIVLDSPFTSIVDVAEPLMWFAPVRLLMRDRFGSIDRIGRVRAPLLILHGEQDRVVPIGLGRRLFEAAPGPKRFVGLPNTGHIGVLENGGLAHVLDFIGTIETRARAPEAQ